MSESDILQLARDGRITLPNSVRRKAGLSAGDLLRAEVTEDGRIVLSPVVAVDRTQAYFWTSRWQAGEREAEQDLQSGRIKTFENVEDFIRELESGD
jgi:AbrB family looped-hinge helix DNA binding protein